MDCCETKLDYTSRLVTLGTPTLNLSCSERCTAKEKMHDSSICAGRTCQGSRVRHHTATQMRPRSLWSQTRFLRITYLEPFLQEYSCGSLIRQRITVHKENFSFVVKLHQESSCYQYPKHIAVNAASIDPNLVLLKPVHPGTSLWMKSMHWSIDPI